MQRDAYTKLLDWKAGNTRKPLILNGARQVGKTFLIKQFGQQAYTSYLYLNFEEDPALLDLFKGSLKPKVLLDNLAIYFNQRLLAHEMLLIFDEIQACPEALNSLKYFQEEANEFHIIAAGSLLGIKLANTKGFPVGKVNFLNLYPLSFFEFLDAIQKNQLRTYLENYNTCTPLPSVFDQELCMLLKKYFYIGGMPEAVYEFSKTESLLNIRQIQKEILKAYDLDFLKHAPKENLMKINAVWHSIPQQLAKENKKFVFSVLKMSARGREYEDAIQWLLEAGLILKVYHLNSPKLPLPHYGDTSAFKVFMLDVGLLSAMSEVPVQSVLKAETLFSEFNGALTENYVAQVLQSLQYPLYYWTSEHTAEVDFIIQHELQLFPLEVKAGESRRKKSLLAYAHKYNPLLLLRTSARNLKKEEHLLNIPLYFFSKLKKLLSIVL
jgi:predicted AAA+ superfamily ATPase